MQRPQQQIDELTDAAHHHPKPRVRVKALAVRAEIRGMPLTQVAQVFATSRQIVGKWVSDYQEGGISALQVAPGRGRKPTVDEKELVDYALQSPHNFGINRSRWTLRLLAQTVPSLRGFTDAGVRVALKRCGLSYKRGQPWMLSPDPQYEKKRQVIAAALEHARRHPQSVVAVFEDEASFYRQPSQGWLWSWAGRQQPRMAWSQRSNTLVRAAAGLDTSSGNSHYLQAPKIGVARLIQFYRQLLEAYPKALMIYLIQDNWPVHFHADIITFLAQHPRLQILRLPTYAPRLNPAEKLWRWTRQRLCHAHPYCDDFGQYKAQLNACFVQAALQPAAMRRYCGLDNAKIFT